MFNVNIKARINRHSRIFKENILNKSSKKLHKWHWYNIVVLIFLFVIPIYPAFAGLVYTNTEYDFYRWDIDESSILDSYSVNNNSEDKSLILESKDSFLSVNTLDDNWRDLSWTNEIINYEVQNWDSIWSIANRFEVSANSISWANWFWKNHIIHPWDKIKVPPVSWLVHYVQKWENIDSITKKYWIDKKSILEQNLIKNNKNLVAWEVLVIPWAIKKIEPKPVIKEKVIAKSKSKKTKNNRGIVNSISKEKWSYNLVWRAPKWKFYWWNCTRYVAQYKNVNWSWNAKNWLANARAKWHKTSSEASVWAIIVFNWRWYNPTYWHVWIVTGISWDKLIISDMNYRRLWEVTSRKISKNDSAIKWYIIVD